MKHLRLILTFSIAIFLMLFQDIRLEAQAGNLLKTIDIRFKVRNKMPGSSLDFTEIVRSSDADGYVIIAGEELVGAVQPVGIIQNVSDRQLEFRTRFRIQRKDNDRIVFNRIVPVDSVCLALPDSLSQDCTGDPYVQARYSKVSESDGNYTAEPLPFPGPDNLFGIPPGGYVQVQFPPFEPNEFVPHHIGEFDAILIAIPVDPETGEELGEQYLPDNTLKITLISRRLEEIELYSPVNNSLNISPDTTFIWSRSSGALSYEIQFSEDEYLSGIFKQITTTGTFSKIPGLEPHSRYYWRARAVYAGSLSEWSYIWNFTTGAATGIFDEIDNNLSMSVFPNPGSNYTRISFRNDNPEKVFAEIFDLRGELIEKLTNGYYDKGEHSLVWKTDDIESGVYYCRLRVGESLVSKKIVILR